MAEFIQTCPHCNTDLQMQDEWICMEVACPTCQNKLIVEKAVMQIQPAADEKICPLCGGVIKEKATFCKHCRQYLHKKSSVRIRCIIVHIIMAAISCGLFYGLFYLTFPKYRKNRQVTALMVLAALGQYALNKIKRNTK